jgi:hypothetical protein
VEAQGKEAHRATQSGKGARVARSDECMLLGNPAYYVGRHTDTGTGDWDLMTVGCGNGDKAESDGRGPACCIWLCAAGRSAAGGLERDFLSPLRTFPHPSFAAAHWRRSRLWLPVLIQIQHQRPRPLSALCSVPPQRSQCTKPLLHPLHACIPLSAVCAIFPVDILSRPAQPLPAAATLPQQAPSPSPDMAH